MQSKRPAQKERMKTRNKEKFVHSTLVKVTENEIGLVTFIHSGTGLP